MSVSFFLRLKTGKLLSSCDSHLGVLDRGFRLRVLASLTLVTEGEVLDLGHVVAGLRRIPLVHVDLGLALDVDGRLGDRVDLPRSILWYPSAGNRDILNSIGNGLQTLKHF